MCLIVLAEAERLDESTAMEMYEANDKGAGIAWRDKGLVHWRKGLTEDEAVKAALSTELPYVMHFRTPSSGTSTLPGVCHPFPITAQVELNLEGATKGWTLFHNGFWPNWKEKIIDYALKSGKKIPTGSWSDSRGLAWVAYNWGLGALELIDEKVLVFGPEEDDMELYGDRWVNYEFSPGKRVLVSNEHWKSWSLADRNRLPNHYMKGIPKQLKGHVGGGAANSKPFHGGDRGVDGDATSAHDKQKTVQAANKEANERSQEALNMCNWVRGKNPSSTKLPVCTTCHKPNKFITSADGLTWQCTDCTSDTFEFNRDCVDCGKLGQLYFQGSWRCAPCFDSYQSRHSAYRPKIFDCWLCGKAFQLADVHYVGHETGTGTFIWQCTACRDKSPVVADEDVQPVVNDPNLEKRLARKKDGIEIIGPIS